MRNVEQIVEQIRVAAGADFAFVLTRKGRLVTHRAPRDMPEVGRARLVRAAKPLSGTERMIEMTLPREELVPYGGAAPVDVYLGVVAEQAVVCVVVATWADKQRVAPALQVGMEAIEPLLRRGLPTVRRSPPDTEAAKGFPFVPERAGALESRPLVDLHASLIPEVPWMPSVPSHPEITLSEAPLGRESMVAIRRDAVLVGSMPEILVSELPLGRESMVAIRNESLFGASSPEITLGVAPLGRESLAAIHHDHALNGSAPEITLGEAPLGRESMVAIRREHALSGSSPEISTVEGALGRESLVAVDAEERHRPSSSPDAIRVELVSMPELEVSEVVRAARMTLPWVEPAADTKRAADAARLGRKLSPPRVTLKLEDLESELESGLAQQASKG